MQNYYAAAIVAVAIGFLFLVARSSALRSRGAARPGRQARRPGGLPDSEGELVAVIAAAVAAASGMEPGSFRIASLSASAPSSRECGFNTPVWGHIDRSNLGE
jgi:hypothetical protein